MKIKPSGIPACSLSKPLRRYEMNELLMIIGAFFLGYVVAGLILLRRVK
jgi:hypothetical protein